MAWTKMKTAVVAGVVVLLAAGIATDTIKEIQAHRTYPNIEGAWEGALSVQAVQQTTRLVLKIGRTNGTYIAALDSVDQGIKDIPVSTLNIGKDAISFEMAGLKAKFFGNIDSGRMQMSGKWQQGKISLPLVFKHTTNPDTITEPLAETDS